jgi:hypothetical protein
MPIQAQPPGRRGTVGAPYSALNLRLGLALFGVIFCGLAAAALLLWTPLDVLAWILVALGAIAAVDAVVVQRRRRARAREGDKGHSLFE